MLTLGFVDYHADGTVLLDEISDGAYATADGWSNGDITNTGLAGNVHGPWGSDVTDFYKSLALTSSGTCTVTWRSWMAYTRDGETDYLYINDVLVWSATAHHSGCANDWLQGPSDFPSCNLDHPACYYDGYWSGDCVESMTLRFVSSIDQAEGDESWAVSHVKISIEGQ